MRHSRVILVAVLLVNLIQGFVCRCSKQKHPRPPAQERPSRDGSTSEGAPWPWPVRGLGRRR